MIPTVITLYALACLVFSSVPSAQADCNSPGWSEILANPLQSGSGTITSSPNHQVSAVKRLGNNDFNGLKFMASDDDGQSSMGLYALGDSKWTEQAGYTGANFTDFYMFNVGTESNNDMYLLYVDNGKDLYIVTESGDSTSWSNNQLIYSDSNGIRFPQGEVIDGNVYVAIQSVSNGSVVLLYRGESDSSFVVWGLPTYPNNNQFAAGGQYAMFQGSVDQGSDKTLWFFFVYSPTAFPYVAYATSLVSGNVQLSTPQLVGDLPLYSTTSVSAIGKDDTYQAVLFRTGYVEEGDPTPYGVYTVIKLSSGAVDETCEEQAVTWGSDGNGRVASNWSPALTSSSLSADVVTLTWVDSQDGSLNALSGNPW